MGGDTRQARQALVDEALWKWSECTEALRELLNTEELDRRTQLLLNFPVFHKVDRPSHLLKHRVAEYLVI